MVVAKVFALRQNWTVNKSLNYCLGAIVPRNLVGWGVHSVRDGRNPATRTTHHSIGLEAFDESALRLIDRGHRLAVECEDRVANEEAAPSDALEAVVRVLHVHLEQMELNLLLLSSIH